MMSDNGESPESDLILIARDVTGQIITSITCTNLARGDWQCLRYADVRTIVWKGEV